MTLRPLLLEMPFCLETVIRGRRMEELSENYSPKVNAGSREGKVVCLGEGGRICFGKREGKGGWLV